MACSSGFVQGNRGRVYLGIFPGLQGKVFGQFRYKGEATFQVIDNGITMLQTIGNDQPFGLVYRIISCRLVKHGLAHFNRGGFAFNNHKPLATGIVNNQVRSFLKFVELESAFDLDQ